MLNGTYEKLKQRSKVFGTTISHFSWTGVVPLLKKRNIDFVIIELEHNFFDWRDMEGLLRTSNTVALTAFVRITELAYNQVSKVLDLGANGIIIPRIETVAELERAVDMMRLPPRGRKGVGGYDFSGDDLLNKLANYNMEKMIIIQMENPTAIANLGAMLDMKEVAGVIVGPYDLSVSMEIPGQLQHPRFIQAVNDVIEICGKYQVSCGMYMGSSADMKYWRERGMNIIWSGSDIDFYVKGYHALCDTVEQMD
ncbi:HpcH/HpaI aldolase family protein [Paenibacillus eucommiae]|uniref:2-keto-3-deoxy-L-rhamnonate aldolase RhmA n=1 Tax=Paenibacillus eucommiae TaxID=1355755 RepID=A0ABS4JA07_9BACL|nr:aldolase/citrate lyase family protein [Paenibacillus eucommiae]MBP1996679.1 2-keto-3-deoxy-L-rhamnonate aldolase RhmA [Paenibacillus eucommiae]